MKTCQECKDKACPDSGSTGVGCEDFTSKAIKESLPDWQPTLADFEKLEVLYVDGLDEIARLEARLEGYENAVAGLVKWAQGDEAP